MIKGLSSTTNWRRHVVSPIFPPQLEINEVSYAPGAVVSWGDTQVVATVAANSISGKAQVQSNGAWSNAVSFMVNSPVISAVTPATGVAGTQVTITGSGFASAQGRALPAEALPAKIHYAGIRFDLASATGKGNAVTAHGQTIALPRGEYNRIYLLAAASDGDQKAGFRAGDEAVELNIQEWTNFIGQWDDRIWKKEEGHDKTSSYSRSATRTILYGELGSIRPGFIKRADVAWFSSHRHDAGGKNEPYAYSYLFAYALDLPPGAHTLTLPENDRIHLMAVTVSNAGKQVRPVHQLYDTLERDKGTSLAAR